MISSIAPFGTYISEMLNEIEVFIPENALENVVYKMTVFFRCVKNSVAIVALRWRHNERESVSNHQPHDCLLNRLSERRSK